MSDYPVRQLLPDRIQHMDEVVTQELRQHSPGGQARFPDYVWRIAGARVGEAVKDALDADVFTLLARAWGKARELHEYTDTDKHPPDTPESVFLGSHQLTVEVHPVVAVTVGSVEYPRLRFTLKLAADFRVAELVILNKHIVAICSGECTLRAQLKYGQVAMHDQMESRRIKLSQVLQLPAPGVPLA